MTTAAIIVITLVIINIATNYIANGTSHAPIIPHDR